MDTNGNNVASTPDSDTMVMEETSPSNQSDSHMSSIEEEKSQKSDGDNSWYTQGKHDGVICPEIKREYNYMYTKEWQTCSLSVELHKRCVEEKVEDMIGKYKEM